MVYIRKQPKGFGKGKLIEDNSKKSTLFQLKIWLLMEVVFHFINF